MAKTLALLRRSSLRSTPDVRKRLGIGLGESCTCPCHETKAAEVAVVFYIDGSLNNKQFATNKCQVIYTPISLSDFLSLAIFSGDFRMTFGEDRNKVKNIVGPQIGKFRELYAPFWPSLATYADFNTSSGRCEQDTSPSARMFHLNLLPKKIQVNYATPNVVVKVDAHQKPVPTKSADLWAPHNIEKKTVLQPWENMSTIFP